MRGQQHDVAGPQRVDRLLVGVEPDELPFRRYVHLLGELGLQGLETALQAILEQVGHGVELDRTTLGHKRIVDRAGAATSTADQRQLDRRVLRGVTPRNRQRGQRGYSHGLSGQPQKLSTRCLDDLGDLSNVLMGETS